MRLAGAIGRAAEGELLFAGLALLALRGLWLLVSSSARRTLLAERGGLAVGRRQRLVQRLDARLVGTRRGAELAARLRSAGTDRTAGQFASIVVGAALGGYLLASLLFPPVIALVMGGAAVWSCFIWLERKLGQRRDAFVAQLPEVARLLSNGAAAGLSMPAAIELAVREIEPPAKDELQVVIDELGLGRSLADSLESLQRRLPSREIAVLMTTLIIQQRAGGDVVRALQEISDTLNQRRETLREVRTLMAGAVFTSYIVPALGIGSLFILNAINSQTLYRMTTNPVGIGALVVAGILYVLAFVAIRSTTRIEV